VVIYLAPVTPGNRKDRPFGVFVASRSLVLVGQALVSLWTGKYAKFNYRLEIPARKMPVCAASEYANLTLILGFFGY